jgi:hypothetical protein
MSLVIAGFWFAASNHCALGAASQWALTGNTHHHCQGPGKGKHSAGHDEPDKPHTCCKEITKIAPPGKEVQTSPIVFLLLYSLPFAHMQDVFHSTLREGIFEDIGPPGSAFHVSIFSSACLLGNAPPFFA